MKRLSLSVIVVSACFTFLFLCSHVYAEIELNGDLEIDTSYLNSTDDSTSVDTTEHDLTGRIKIVPSIRKESGNLFMEAKAEILAKTDNTVGTDDVWGKIGTSTFDFQIGRFEGWSLFDKSNDMLIVDAPNGAERYEANYARGRFDAPGQFALHFFPGDIFSCELGAVYGKESDEEDEEDEVDDESENNKIGVRPVINFEFGPLTLAGGFDYVQTTKTLDDNKTTIDEMGYGAKIKGQFGMATLGLNYAQGTRSEQDYTGADLPDETTVSYGAYCDLAFTENAILTLAGYLTTWEQDQNNADKEHLQYVMAYAHPLPIDGATIKFAISYASATEKADQGDIESDAIGFKIRLNYAF